MNVQPAFLQNSALRSSSHGDCCTTLPTVLNKANDKKPAASLRIHSMSVDSYHIKHEKASESPNTNLMASGPIMIPKTVPLSLESSNDILPESPGPKWWQISPEKTLPEFTFPEVTLSNIIAIKTKVLSKHVKESLIEPENKVGETKGSKGKSGSIPANFVYSDEAFAGNIKNDSIGDSLVDSKNSVNVGIAQDTAKIFEDSYCSKLTQPNNDCRNKSLLNKKNLDDSVNAVKQICEIDKERTPRLVVSGSASHSDTQLNDFPFNAEVEVNFPNNPVSLNLSQSFETDLSSIPSSHSLVAEEDFSKLSAPMLNHSSSSPSLPSKSEGPHHHCKKPKPVRTDAPRRHRHSVAGHHHNFKQNLSYFKLYGISVGPTGVIFNQSDKTKNKLLGSTSSLFSTAVISGSSSAPNLRDSIGTSTTVSGKVYFMLEYIKISIVFYLFASFGNPSFERS